MGMNLFPLHTNVYTLMKPVEEIQQSQFSFRQAFLGAELALYIRKRYVWASSGLLPWHFLQFHVAECRVQVTPLAASQVLSKAC